METLLLHGDLIDSEFFTTMCTILKKEGVSRLIYEFATRRRFGVYGSILSAGLNKLSGDRERWTSVIPEAHIRSPACTIAQNRVLTSRMRHRGGR